MHIDSYPIHHKYHQQTKEDHSTSKIKAHTVNQARDKKGSNPKTNTVLHEQQQQRLVPSII